MRHVTAEECREVICKIFRKWGANRYIGIRCFWREAAERGIGEEEDTMWDVMNDMCMVETWEFIDGRREMMVRIR